MDLSVIRNGNIDGLKELLDGGGDVNHQDGSGNTALIVVSSAGHIQMA